jgi:microcystin degradation protein MlrC
VKNMMNFRVGYRDVMKGYFVLDLPGPTPPDMRQLPFARIRRPLHPFDSFDGQPPLSVVHSNRRTP